MEHPGVPVASANTFIQCPCPSCHFLSSLNPSTRRKSNCHTRPSSPINLSSSNILLFAMNPLPDPCICPSGPLWFIVHVSRLNGVEIYGMHWEQVRSFFEYDDSLRRHLHTLMPHGYLEFHRAYELDHLNSTAWFADPGVPALNEITTPPDAREYLGTRRPVSEEQPTGFGGPGEGRLTENQQAILTGLLWELGARVTRQHASMTRGFETRKAKRAARSLVRGPVTDRTHHLPTLFETQTPARGASTDAFPTPIAVTPTVSGTLTGQSQYSSTPTPVAGPSCTSFPSALPPMIPHSSILDEPILTDEDLEMLNEPTDASAEKDAEGEVDTETELSVEADKGKDTEKEPKK